MHGDENIFSLLYIFFNIAYNNPYFGLKPPLFSSHWCIDIYNVQGPRDKFDTFEK